MSHGTITIRERCIPPTTTHRAKKIVKHGGFSRLADEPKLTAAKGFWDALFLPHRPEAPFDGPLVLDVELRWPHNSTTAKRDLGKDLPMDRGVDLDNMSKTVMDALARCGFMVNDSRVVDLRLRKWKSPNPGIIVRLGVLE